MPAWSCLNCEKSVNMINNWLNVPPVESIIYTWNKNHPVWSGQLVSSSHLFALIQQWESYVHLITFRDIFASNNQESVQVWVASVHGNVNFLQGAISEIFDHFAQMFCWSPDRFRKLVKKIVFIFEIKENKNNQV